MIKIRVLFLGLVVLVTIIVNSGIFTTAQAASDSFSFKQTDKQLHMTASYGLALTATRLLETRQMSRWESVLYASLFTLAVGTSKELILDDAFSGADMLANTFGTATSAAMVFAFEL